MSNQIKIIAGAAVVVVFFGLASVFNHRANVVSLGNVAPGNECTATTSVSSWANAPHVIATTSSSLYPDIHTLCSVIIGTTDASIVQLMDATSSTDVSSTTIGVLAASPANGSNMPFNVSIKRGLMVNTVTNFAGRYTFTYR